MSATDFDVKNYNTQELLSILNIEHKIPLTKALIIDETQKKIDKFDNKPIFKAFFFEVRKKLLAEKDDFNTQNKYEEDDSNYAEATELIKNASMKKQSTKNTILDDDKLIIKPNDVPQQFSQSVFYSQGTKNPTKIHTIERILNFDSHYRTILDPNSVSCGDEIRLNSNIRLDSATNFTVNLAQPLQNVVKMKLKSLEIPLSWYNFNKDYGTNYFTIDIDNSLNSIFIPEGNYPDATTLINNLNTASDEHSIIFSHEPLTNKITIINNNSSDIIISWYIEDQIIQECSKGGGVGQKVDYNLGWLLGFRHKDYIIEPTKTVTGEALLDLLGSKYILLSLDDFCNSKPNQDLLSNVSNKNNFSLPAYYNKETMGPNSCPPNQFPVLNACSGAGIKNMDLSSNLTEKQRYTIDQLRLAMDGKPADRYTSPNSTDIIGRIPISRDPTSSFQNIVYTNLDEKSDNRIYFGPVNLSKFRIRLLNDKGLILNLNNMDWSFSIIVTQLYQY